MPTIANYNQFDGTHWETGSVRSFFAQRGFIAPHTGKPYGYLTFSRVTIR